MHRTDAPRRRRGGDDGFTLIEVIVATAIISVVMLGLGAVFVATAAGTDAQGSRQVAARIATDGLDRAHALTGANVVKGRDTTSVATQWAARPTGVSNLLSGLTAASDASAAGSGTTMCTTTVTTNCASLPTVALSSTVDKIVYQQSFFVAGCQLNTAGTCLAAVASGTVPMYNVVVSVAWRDKSCKNNTCTYQLSTLLSVNTSDPIFNSNYKPSAPQIGAILNSPLVQDITELVNLPQATWSGGNGAVTLTATGLPAGVTLDPNTGIFSGTLSAITPATTVTVTATDRFNLFTSTTFSWTVNALPQVTSAVVPLVAGLLQTVNLADTLKLTGGTGPFTWACTGLTLGATLNAATGILTIPAAALGLLNPSCTATDARGKSSTGTVSATLLAPLSITSPADNSTGTVYRILGVSTTATVTGCSGTCTWSATNLPSGITINATSGLISGKPTVAGTYKIVFTVRDTANRTDTATVTWRVI